MNEELQMRLMLTYHHIKFFTVINFYPASQYIEMSESYTGCAIGIDLLEGVAQLVYYEKSKVLLYFPLHEDIKTLVFTNLPEALICYVMKNKGHQCVTCIDE